ncbi:MAG: DUF2214 family protein [Longimicrobiales bacterium]
MLIRWLVASLHFIALGIGLGAIAVRSAALRGPLDAAGLARVFRADALWGLAALLWVSTGLARAFGGLEKGTAYYLDNHFFWTKMVLFILIIVLEMWPMMTLIRWRNLTRRGQSVDTQNALQLSRLGAVQAGIVILIVFVAVAMARGVSL